MSQLSFSQGFYFAWDIDTTLSIKLEDEHVERLYDEEWYDVFSAQHCSP